MNLLQIFKKKASVIYAKYIMNDSANEEIIENLPIFYIGGSQTLPPPLLPEEEECEIKKLEKGDSEAKKTLVERNLRLVVYIAKKFENTGNGIEDLISIGTIGLMKAINTYDAKKNIKLATYASRCIENEILMYLRRSNKLKSEISIDEPLNQDGDGNELLLSDILGSDADIVSKGLEDEVDKKYYLLECNLKLKENLPVIKEQTNCIQIGTLDIKGIDQIKRVYSPDGISPTLTTMNGEPKIEENQETITATNFNPRIRKLTPLECWRLMGFDDEDFYNAQSTGNSNSQLYKQARKLNCSKGFRKNIFKFI